MNFSTNDPDVYELDSVRKRFGTVEKWTQIGLHATGGIRGHKGVCETMRARNLGIHFVLEQDGSFVQVLNLGLRGAHLKGVNDICLGIEIVSPLFDGPLAAKERTKGIVRPEYKHTMKGRTTNFVGLTKEQMEAALHFVPKLCDDLGIPRRVPTNKDGSLKRDSFATLKEAREYSGVMGHLHFHNFKQDPGYDVLEALWQKFKK